MNDISGRGLRKLLGYYDHDTSSWRTSAPTRSEDSTLSSVILTDSGTWERGQIFALPTLVAPTVGKDSSSLLLTPTANLGINGGTQHPDKRRAGGHGPTLADQVEFLLPTPAVNDMGRGKTVVQWDEWTDKMKAKHKNGNGHGKSLEIEAQRLLPTPAARDYKDTLQTRHAVTGAADYLPRAIGEMIYES
jgi:hypothetical protein